MLSSIKKKISMYYHTKELTENGSCAWPKCKETGKDWQDGKCYCEKHYEQAMMKQMTLDNNEPVGKAAMGANTVVINDSG